METTATGPFYAGLAGRAATRDELPISGGANWQALPETLNARLGQWKPEMAEQVRERLAELIELADQDVLDQLRSRAREQEVLDIPDAPPTR
jgi:hypothetical protein